MLPLQPGTSVWRTLIGACKSHGNSEIPKPASNCLLNPEPEDQSAFEYLGDLLRAEACEVLGQVIYSWHTSL